MANTKSAKKKTKVIKKKTAINRVRIGKYKGAITQMEELIKSGDKSKIDKFFSTFQSQLMKVSKKGSIKRKTASRKISRISKKISTIKK
jgi:small subunit ribosomal protein S20